MVSYKVNTCVSEQVRVTRVGEKDSLHVREAFMYPCASLRVCPRKVPDKGNV